MIKIRIPKRGRTRRTRLYQIAALVALVAATSPAVVASAHTSKVSANSSHATAQFRQMAAPPGVLVHAQTFKTAPIGTTAQRKAAERALALSPRPAPNWPRAPHRAAVAHGTPPTLKLPAAGAPRPLAGGAAKTFRNTVLPNIPAKSPVNEPSTSGSGKVVFATGNWYAGYSLNNGSTWTYLNPFTIFGSGFCCDQVTTYDASHNRIYWLGQYSNGINIATAAGTNPATWCSYRFTPATFGLPSTDAFDYNHMAISSNWLYWTTNDYAAAGFRQALIVRIPLHSLLAPPGTCRFPSFQSLGRADEFSDAFVQNANDTMYWWTSATSRIGAGAGLAIDRANDNSAAVSVNTRAVDPFIYMSPGANTGQCGSTDGVVLNWCQRTDSRPSGGGYLAISSLGERTGFSPGVAHDNDEILGVAVNARQDAAHGRPFPFTRRFYFRASDLAYLGFGDEAFSNAAVLYPDMAPDNRGHIGAVFAWGGGTGTTHFFPGSAFMIDDDVSPVAFNWATVLYLSGAGNACLNTQDKLRRWGDYLTVRPWEPSRNVWLGTGFRLTANAGACNVNTPAVEVHNIVFGRGSDSASYTRWKNA